MPDDNDYYYLDPAHTDPKRIRKEREKARKLRATSWWNEQTQKGLCHYCGKKFAAQELTMDHVVPLARGGESNKGNIVPACRDCNREKKLETPAERLLREMGQKSDKKSEGDES